MTDFTKPHGFTYTDYEEERGKKFCACGLPEDNPIHIRKDKSGDHFVDTNKKADSSVPPKTNPEGWELVLSDALDLLRCDSCKDYWPDPCEKCAFPLAFANTVGLIRDLLTQDRQVRLHEEQRHSSRAVRKFRTVQINGKAEEWSWAREFYEKHIKNGWVVENAGDVVTLIANLSTKQRKDLLEEVVAASYAPKSGNDWKSNELERMGQFIVVSQLKITEALESQRKATLEFIEKNQYAVTVKRPGHTTIMGDKLVVPVDDLKAHLLHPTLTQDEK